MTASDWKQRAHRVRASMRADHAPLAAAGVAFYGFLSLVPALAATVSLYGLLVLIVLVGAYINADSGHAPSP